MRSHFHLFVYGTLMSRGKAAAMMRSSELVKGAQIGGVLYDIDGDYPALVLYGSSPVKGEIWRCPNELLPALDTYEGVAEGLFRRVGVSVDGIACWTYVAGPKLTQKLVPASRITA
jgi:gamma-glutamylcyclotransferase (GGCT)/AIG2-like uncharacterized protein YtfP